MSCSALGRRLVACLLNISEARRKDLVETVARSAITDIKGEKREGVTVLNIFNDSDYNRSVITVVANIELIREAVLSACECACSLIDMSVHEGIHPCMGAVDLVPLYPLGEDVGLQDCGEEAQALALTLAERVAGTSAFLFGWADSPQHRGLAQRRKEIGWFRKVLNVSNIKPDIGSQPTRRYGITGVGASPYVMNCNVTIDTQDLALGRSVASAIRESSPGGIPGVQVMALPHEGAVEIACNVESVHGSSSSHGEEQWPNFSIGGQTFCHAPASLITARVAELIKHHGVAIKGTALVGFTPRECRRLAEGAISNGIGEFWKEPCVIPDLYDFFCGRKKDILKNGTKYQFLHTSDFTFDSMDCNVLKIFCVLQNVEHYEGQIIVNDRSIHFIFHPNFKITETMHAVIRLKCLIFKYNFLMINIIRNWTKNR